jgi:hypothetical protein
MRSIRGVWPTEHGVVFSVATPAARVVDVLIDGRRVWSFRESSCAVAPEPLPPGAAGEHLRFEPWPPAIRARLRGCFTVALRAIEADGSAQDPVAATADLGGDGPPALADIYGRPLVVNKWGRLGHTLADAEPGLVDRMLDHMDEIRDLLQAHLGPVVCVTGGTLLGPIRDEGRLIPHDDDADLTYLSSWDNPADVARENFELGRLMSETGYDVIRLSAAHLQVHFTHNGVPDHYVDVFGGFLRDGYLLQTFALRARMTRDQLLPTKTIMVEGRPEPAPREPEKVLTENYGPNWRIPDPSFTFDLPEPTAARFHGWYADYHADRESWENLVLLGEQTLPAEDCPSSFADWVHRITPPDHAILELGCGLGVDARALAASGRTVRAVDFSRSSSATARSRAVVGQGHVSFELVNLLDLRAVLRLGAICAGEPQPWTVYGRRVLNALESGGRDNVFRLCGMVVRQGGAAHLDIVSDTDYAGIPPHLRLSTARVAGEAARHGLVLDEATTREEPMTWVGEVGEEQLVEISRMTFRRRK